VRSLSEAQEPLPGPAVNPAGGKASGAGGCNRHLDMSNHAPLKRGQLDMKQAVVYKLLDLLACPVVSRDTN